MKSFVVNYIWVNKTDRVVPIPPKAFALLQKNAAMYSDIPFILWVDDLQVFQDYLIPTNVSIRLLETEKYFLAYEKIKDISTFEARVDFLRLLILQKILSGDPQKVVVYADFDIFDLCLFSKDLAQRIDEFGMAFSGTYYPIKIQNTIPRLLLPNKVQHVQFKKGKKKRNVIRDVLETGEVVKYRSNLKNRPEYIECEKIIHNEYEIGFMTFSAQNLSFLDALISHCLKDLIRPNQVEDLRDTTYFSIARYLDEWSKTSAKKRKSAPINWRTQIASFYVQYCSGWRLDDNLALIPDRKGALSLLREKLIKRVA